MPWLKAFADTEGMPAFAGMTTQIQVEAIPL